MSKLLEQLTITDPLTGLYNRRYLNLQAPHIIARAKRNKTSICVAMCDINPSDDYSLQHLAHCLQAETREGQDTAYRLDCDDYLVVMEQSDESSGRVVLDRVQSRFSQNSSDVTLSIGIASVSWKDLGSYLDDILKLAAENMIS
ncbi:MAG: GGDEF domain-containing protein [Bacillota bacterium]|nr:GGDEF domain-containing protein [Bacillota bacterium]